MSGIDVVQDRKAKAREYNRQYRAKHGEKLRAKARARYAEDAEYRREINAKGRAWHAKNRDVALARKHAYRAERRAELSAKQRAYRAEHRKEINVRQRKWRQANLEHVRRHKKERYAQLREQALDGLGGKCVQCGFRDPGALCVVRADGNRHHGSPERRLRDALNPGKYQLVCQNCIVRRSHGSDETQASKKVVRQQQRHARLMQEVFERLGGECVHCGLTDREVLCVDHVNNDGAEHRRSVPGQIALMREVVADAASGRFQVLCHNCNMLKSRETIAA